jgi:hypothetical protein
LPVARSSRTSSSHSLHTIAGRLNPAELFMMFAP